MQDDVCEESPESAERLKTLTDSPSAPTMSGRRRSGTQSTKAEKTSKSDKSLKRKVKEKERTEKQARRELLRKEKEARRLQREDDRAKREKERIRREEERAKRGEEKRSRECEKEAKRAFKDEMRARKDEEKKAKEEMRINQEAERLREEERKQRRIDKQRALLRGFFVQPEKPENAISDGLIRGSSDGGAHSSPFMQFELKKDQRQSPICRVWSDALKRIKWQNLEDLRRSWRSDQSATDGSRLGLVKFGQPNYLHELRTCQIKPLSFPITWPAEMPDGGGVPLQNMVAMRFNHGDSGNGGTVWVKAKLLQFFENYRPAFYGTWRRRSYTIRPRRPFAKDYYQLDYEIDSDDEWEEDEPGENISQSDGEEEEEIDDDEEEDAKFLVPHGYLSDDEGVHDEDYAEGNGGGIGSNSGSGETAEMKRLRQRLSLAEYETAHSRSLHKLKPLLLGPTWTRDPLGSLRSAEVLSQATDYGSDDDKENCIPFIAYSSEKNGNRTSTVSSKGEHELVQTALRTYRVYLWPGTVLPILPKTDPVPIIHSAASKTPSTDRSKKRFPKEAIPYLIRLVHKNALSKAKLQFEFRVFWLKHTWTGEGEALNCCPLYKDYCHSSEVESVATTTTVADNPAGSEGTEDLKLQHKQSGFWDRLPLSKTLTSNKISEIAAFEESLWRVRPEILEAHKKVVLDLAGLPKADESSHTITDPDFVFPQWSYLTDIAMVASTKHKSLPSPSPLTKRSKMTKSTSSSPMTTTVKKRTTLETFFSPPRSSKRPKTNGRGSDDDNCEGTDGA